MCPDENTIAGYLQGTLPESGVRAVDAHVDTCPSCREMMSELGRVTAQVSEPPAEPEESPRLIHRYVVEATIGRGGMGEVLLAYDPVLHRPVAIKLIRRDLFDGQAGAIDRLVREARAMATLAHPYVITIYDAGLHDGQVFLAMEYVKGMTLDFWLATAAPSWQLVVQRFVEAGRGLAAAHDAGILHRDFKPQNVMIGADGRTRVMDFGLARPLDAMAASERVPSNPMSPSGGNLTAVGAVVGTPAYMSPEQLQGQRVDARSDVFSFCVSLYEALFGVRPFAGATLDELRWNMMQQRPRQGANLHGVPNELIAVITRGFSVSPLSRPPSMHALLAEMEEAQTEDSHVKIHIVCQGFFALCHVVTVGWFVFDTYIKPGGASSPSTAGTSSDLTNVETVAAAFFFVWVLMAFVFMFAGPFWSVLNAVGLGMRRNWARVSTIIYGVFALSSCIGIPYGIYALWSLTRSTTKRALNR